MGRQKTIPIPRFEAFDDSGRRFSIIGSQKLFEGSPTGDQGDPEWSPGPLLLRTVEGQRVNRMDKGHYEVLAPTPVRVTSTDPRAP